jgi:hypothetical protein
MAVALSIVVAAATMLDLGLSLLLPQLPPRLRRPVVLTYAGGFAAVVVLMDDSFTRIVYFYLPTLILLLLASAQQAVRCRSAGWTLILTGLLLSAGAAMLQQARVALHPVYFDTTRSTTWCRASRSCSSTSDGAVRPTRRWHLAGEVSLSSLPDHVQPRKDQRA